MTFLFTSPGLKKLSLQIARGNQVRPKLQRQGATHLFAQFVLALDYQFVLRPKQRSEGETPDFRKSLR